MLDRRTGAPRDRLLELVKEILARNSITRAVSMDHQLTESGLSSIDMVNLMLGIEGVFVIMKPAYDIRPANFRSISTIEALIVKILRSLDRKS
jgi:acyl carrier protein